MATLAINRGRGRSTGRFATRAELTANVWAIHRRQIYASLSGTAAACGTSIEVVRAIVQSEEGLDAYLDRGCPVGG